VLIGLFVDLGGGAGLSLDRVGGRSLSLSSISSPSLRSLPPANALGGGDLTRLGIGEAKGTSCCADGAFVDAAADAGVRNPLTVRSGAADTGVRGRGGTGDAGVLDRGTADRGVFVRNGAVDIDVCSNSGGSFAPAVGRL